jgi:putative endonuclease
MFYVYILQSEKDNKLYIGQTNDINNRLERHNKGEVVATRNRRPLKMLVCKEFGTRKEAMVTEKYLKKLKGGNEFKKIVNQWGIAKW